MFYSLFLKDSLTKILKIQKKSHLVRSNSGPTLPDN